MKLKKKPNVSDSDTEQEIPSSNDKQAINYGKWVFQEIQFVVEFSVHCKKQKKNMQFNLQDGILVPVYSWLYF